MRGRLLNCISEPGAAPRAYPTGKRVRTGLYVARPRNAVACLKSFQHCALASLCVFSRKQASPDGGKKGSPLTMFRPSDGRALTVPLHFRKTVAKGTPHAVLKEAGLRQRAICRLAGQVTIHSRAGGHARPVSTRPNARVRARLKM